jgi:ParB-like chromosome segregation protein Spo0J
LPQAPSADARANDSGFCGQIEMVPLTHLKPARRNARTHSKAQIAQIENSIRAFGFVVPLVVDGGRTILAGHGRYEAAKKMGLAEVPVVRIEGLSETKRRAFALADNKIAENAGWDRKLLAAELPELRELLVAENLDIEITGFAPVEIDQILVDFEENSSDPLDEFDAEAAGPPKSQPGDLWHLGPHRLWCGDARDAESLRRILGDSRAAMAFLDPPYNVKVKDVVGRGRIKHSEFAMASGELRSDEFVKFLQDSLGAAAAVSREGAVHFACMDWRHVDALIEAGGTVYGAMLNLAVWVKSNAGQGSFYRSQHELVGVFRVGGGPHLNNVELGRHGRSRSNVWHYAGVNSFRAGRLDDLRSHPTVKPIGLISDAIKDCTRRGDIVIDTFSGSGTTILAAERTGRAAVCAEIEPRFVDLAIRRWQDFTGKDAIHAKTGQCFSEANGQNEGNSESVS